MSKHLGKVYKVSSGATVTVVKFLGNSKFIGHCSICSEDDPEMWPEGSIILNSSAIVKDQTSCSCAYAPRYTERQHKLRVTRKLKENGYEFIGWKGEFIGNKTLVNFFNPNGTGQISCSNINRIMQGAKDPFMKGNSISESKAKSIKVLLSEFKNTYGEKYEITSSDSGIGKVFKVKCKECSQDPVGLKLDKGEFIASRKTLLRGFYICRCNKGNNYKEEWVSILAEDKLKSLGYKFISTGYFEGSLTDITYECERGNIHTQSLTTVLNGGGECLCTKRPKTDPTWFYLVRWTNNSFEEDTFLKYGITCRRSVFRRLWEQETKCNNEYSPEIICLYRDSEGLSSLSAETYLKKHNKPFKKQKDFPDGYSETIPYSLESIEYIRETLKQFNVQEVYAND